MNQHSTKEPHLVPLMIEKILNSKSRDLLIRLYVYGAFKRLCELGEFFHEKLSDLNIEKRSMPIELLVIHLLFLRIIDLSRSIKILIQAKSYRCIPTLSKSLLEALFDLRGQSIDKEHYKLIQAASDKEKIKYFELLIQNRKMCNEEFPGEYGKIKKRLDEAKRAYSQLGSRPLKIYEKAQKVGLLGMYNWHYMELNLHAHNDMALLNEYHNIVESHEIGTDYYRIRIPDSKPDHALIHIMIANRCLGDALLAMLSIHEQDSSFLAKVSEYILSSEYLLYQKMVG